MTEVKACGVIVFRREPLSFLLMKHPTRWDLPKGHVDPGETDLECALRELEEETGITRDSIRLDVRFLFESAYPVQDRRFPGQTCQKTLWIYLGWLIQPVEIQPTEHIDYAWFPWAPPHRIQANTIDPLLARIEQHFANSELGV